MKTGYLVLFAFLTLLGACEKTETNGYKLPQPDYKYINRLYISDDILWVLSSAPSDKFTFIAITPPSRLSRINLRTNEITMSGKIPPACEISFDNEETPYLGTYDRKVLKINSDLTYDLFLDVPKVYLFQDLVFNSNNNLWIASNGGGLFFYNGTDTSRFTTSNSILNSDGIASMTKDSESNIWFIQGQESFKIDPQNNISKDPYFFPVKYLAGAFNLTADKDNALWVSRWDGNYHRIFKKSFNRPWNEIKPPESSNNKSVKLIKSVNGTIWISYSMYPKDLLAYYDANNKWNEVEIPLDEISITDIVSYGDDLFLGTPKGIFSMTLK
jgi:hypothetical protein